MEITLGTNWFTPSSLKGDLGIYLLNTLYIPENVKNNSPKTVKAEKQKKM